MITVRLGKTGLNVSVIGFGGIPITRPTEEEAVKVIRRAIELGINLFDTAPGYGLGESERRIGKSVKGDRNKVIIATKTGSVNGKDALKDLERSLRQLDTEYIDLWQLGNITTFDKYRKILKQDGALRTAREALQQGKIRHIGLSSHNIAVTLEAISSSYFETIQFPFNLVANEAADKLIPLAVENDVGFIAMKTFAGGHIKDANLALKFLLQSNTVVPNVGIETIRELEEIVDIINNPLNLSVEERKKIVKIRDELNTRFCRHCEECLPCPKGVDIPSLIYLPVAWNLRSARWFKNSVKGPVISYEKCDLCGECEKKCPYHLSIRDIIVENIKFYKSISQEHGKNVRENVKN
jgi:aryl-alcohol dehydrogenase-like predicted oxidoreductase